MDAKEAKKWLINLKETIGKAEYRSLWHYEQAIKEIIDLLDKFDKQQLPLKIKEVHVDEYYCPACGSENNCDQGIVEDKFCPKCGQAIYQNIEGE